jgi:aryl-alcohol dehydrogenase-like predicted oxidoreductase
VLASPFPTYAIIGPRTVDELLRSVGALELELNEDERRWLDLEIDDVAFSVSAHYPRLAGR